jgi:hypothetical protein
MRLFQLVYLSRVARSVRLEDAEQIAAFAAEQNRQRGLTGLLMYSPSHFLQVLEGDEPTVRATFERILRDKRHFEAKVLLARSLEDREFGAWTMTARVMGSGQRFDALDGAAALALLHGR